MFVIFFLNLSIFLRLIGFSYAIESTSFSHASSKSQEELLNHLKPCTFRFVYLENCKSAAEEVLIFVGHYHRHGTFILESIPALLEYSLPNQTYKMTNYDQVRFMSCYTIFYFQDQLFKAIAKMKDKSPEGILWSYFRNYPVQLRKENPPFVVFVTFGKKISAIHYKYVHELDTTSSFYVLSIDNVKLICSRCGNSVFHEPKSIVSNFSWRQMFIRHGKISVCNWFSTKGCDTDFVNPLYACTVYPDSITTSVYLGARKCLFRVLKQKLNTTESRDWSRADGSALFLPMITQYVKLALIDDKHFNQISSAVSYGMSTIRYKFGALTNPQGQDISCMTKPFDELIWLFLFFSTICICLCLRVVSRASKTSPMSEIHLISILLEQSQSIVTKSQHFRKHMFFLILPWMLLSFLIGNAYKGVLFSFLTTPSVQKVPETLHEAVNSRMMIATLARIASINGAAYSLAKDRVDSILENIRAGAITGQDENTYQKFRDKMLFVQNSVVDMFIAIETGAEIYSEVKEESGNHTISRDLMIFDKEETVSLLSELTTLFTNKILTPGRSLDLFSNTELWILRRNAFLRLMIPIFSGLEQAGIYRRWKYFENILIINKILNDTRKKVLNEFETSKTRFSAKDNILAYLLFKPHTAKSVTEAVPISIEYFTVFALLFAYCIAICGVAFTLETLTNIGFKHLFLTCQNKIVGFWFHRKFDFSLSYSS